MVTPDVICSLIQKVIVLMREAQMRYSRSSSKEEVTFSRGISGRNQDTLKKI